MIKNTYSKGQNTFVTILELLRVKHTKSYSNKYFNEHPYNANLLGLSKMLSDYNIRNIALEIKDKKHGIFSLNFPFIAFISNDFVTVLKIGTEKIYYIWRGIKVIDPLDEFIDRWSGIVLIAESDETSIEPNYNENKKNELFAIGMKNILLIGISIFLGFSFYSNYSQYNLGYILILILNLIGVFIGSLLVLKQMHIQSRYADKICLFIKNNDCNNILDSKASKFLGLIGWSEIGLSYFISNTLIMIFIPKFIIYLSFINICVLPYSFWSIWYQKVKVKQWCTLCIIVQLLLWLIFSANLGFSIIQVPTYNIFDLLLLGSIYIVPLSIIFVFLPKLIDGNKVVEITHSINSLKMKDEVFLAVLRQQPHYEVDKFTSSILFGNTESRNLITILSNPHCGPCADLHNRVEALMDQLGNNVCLQYIFTSFNGYESSARFLISAYFNNNSDYAKISYSKWFKGEKYYIEETLNKYGYDIDNVNTIKESEKHDNWNKLNRIGQTPTILINGYILPVEYMIEDIKYFIDINIDA